MAGNKVTLEFAGDASKLAKETEKANMAISDYGKTVEKTSKDMTAATTESNKYLDSASKLSNIVGGATDVFNNVGAAIQSVSDIQNAASDKSKRQARALQDVAQAQQDVNQAVRDSSQALIDSGQATIDLDQANLDVATTHKAYNKAVKDGGKNSDAAKQALIDWKQAQQDVKQAQEDTKQATADNEQATIDQKDAQLDLVDAQKQANPTDFQKVATDAQPYLDFLGSVAPLLIAAALAQGSLNFALFLSPITWIVIGIGLLIAAIILIATHMDEVKEAWKKAWKWIKDAASNVWDWIKKIPGWIGTLFGKIADFITKPFKSAFNAIAEIWNNTIGKLSWSVPDWIPLIGGKTISVPHIPKFHDGGIVPGAAGSEMLALVQAGEKITPAGGSHSEGVNVTVILDGDVLMKSVGNSIKSNGGNAQIVLVGRSA